MALIKCPECGKPVSDQATTCGHCNYPIAAKTEKPNKSMTGKWIFFGLSLLYVTLPFDLIPDIPVLGWIDDTLLLTGATLNLLESSAGQYNQTLGQLVRLGKWIFIFLALLILLLTLLLGTALVRLFS